LNQAESLQECRDAASVILDNSDYLLRIIDDLLEVGKAENLSNKKNVELRIRNQETDISHLICGVYKMFSNSASSKGLYFAISYKTPIPRIIVTDMIRVRQVLINLIGNAIKFTDSGGVRIILSLQDEEENSPDTIFVTRIIRIDICDSGIGITPEVLPRLFQPYQQADNTIQKRFGGTGLGLAISKRITSRLGGEIIVTNNPSGGSTFSFSLPIKFEKDAEFISESLCAKFASNVVETKIDDFNNNAATENKNNDLNRNLNRNLNPNLNLNQDDQNCDIEDDNLLCGCRILLVDDSEDLCRLFGLILTKSGAEVTFASDGESAFKFAVEKGYDVILIDINLPLEDGYSVVCRLRESGYSGQIIAITADDSFESKERAQHAGCNDFAAKPIFRNELIRLVRLRHNYNYRNKN
jgi:CheY-like chemotaxis protein